MSTRYSLSTLYHRYTVTLRKHIVQAHKTGYDTYIKVKKQYKSRVT